MRGPGRTARPPFVNLREFLRFWFDDRPLLTCCQFATAEELETDPELYECGTCAVRAAQGALRPENLAAWRLYEQIVTRFTVDTHTVGLMAEWALRDRDPSEAFDLMARVSVIYAEALPVVAVPKES